jgi:hypothetical protein
MITRNISWGKDGRCAGLKTLPPCDDYFEIWKPQPAGTLRPVQACNVIAFLYILGTQNNYGLCPPFLSELRSDEGYENVEE